MFLFISHLILDENRLQEKKHINIARTDIKCTVTCDTLSTANLEHLLSKH